METIAPNRASLAEALTLSTEILTNLELSNFPLTNIALKASRLARLLNDFDYQKIFAYEAGGYPVENNKVAPEVWRLGDIAGRHEKITNNKTNEVEESMKCLSIAQMEDGVRIAEVALRAAQDPNISLSSANPHEVVSLGSKSNTVERRTLREEVSNFTALVSKRRTFIYEYVLRWHYELKYSGIADDIFGRTRRLVDEKIGQTLPDAVQKFTAIYDNLISENPEDWSNAVHGCRRLIQSVADEIFPPREDHVVEENGKQKTVKLGQDHYVNRLMTFVSDHTQSKRFKEIVGSQLSYLGERLDSVYEATNKGSHETIVSREEADRYVIYTYLLIGDLLSLRDTPK